MSQRSTDNSTYTTGYYIMSPENQYKAEFNKEEFESAVAVMAPDTPYQSDQIFSNNSVQGYTSIVITDIDHDRLEFVKDAYLINPAEKEYAYGKEWLIFRFPIGLSPANYNRYGGVLARLYKGRCIHYHPYNASESENGDQPKNLIPLLVNIGNWIEDASKTGVIDPGNHEYILKANKSDKRLIVDQMQGTEKVDPLLDIIVGYGSPMSYVLHRVGDTDTAYKFFNQYFGTNFSLQDQSMQKYMTTGIVVEGAELYQMGASMYSLDSKGNSRLALDFVPYIHYKVKRGTAYTYIVSMMGKEVVRHVEFPNLTTEGQLVKFIQDFGNFHMHGGKTSITLLHQYMSAARVPTITIINKYGYNKIRDKEFIIYRDYAVDVNTKKVFPRHEGSDFYMIDGIHGVKVEDTAGANLYETLGEKTPFFGNLKQYPLEKYIELLTNVYSDESSYILPMMACTWLGAMLYKPPTKCPLFFVTGPTGSGKTTYANVISSIFGVKKLISLEGTTAFPLRIGLTMLDGIPLFMNEFRTNMMAAYEKTQILKALFDGTPFERGRKDLTLEKYQFSAGGFIEGEELPESGATRTRTIIHRTSREGMNKLGVSPERFLEEHRTIFEAFQNSYIMKSDREKYLAYITEGENIFGKITCPSQRILVNISMMYAGTMAFAPGLQHKIIEVLTELMVKQIEDYSRNSTGMEFIKVLARYVENKYAQVYTKGYDIIISWQDVIEYISRYRIQLELKPDAYRDHLLSDGFKLGHFEVESGNEFDQGKRLIDGMSIHCSQLPDALKSNKFIYKLYTDYEANKVIY